MDDLKIPQIKPEKSILVPESVANSSTVTDTPVIKKIEPKTPGLENTQMDPTDLPATKSKTGKYVLMGLAALLVIFVVGILIPGVVVYGSAKKLTKSAQAVKAAVAT